MGVVLYLISSLFIRILDSLSSTLARSHILAIMLWIFSIFPGPIVISLFPPVCLLADVPIPETEQTSFQIFSASGASLNCV